MYMKSIKYLDILLNVSFRQNRYAHQNLSQFQFFLNKLSHNLV